MARGGVFITAVATRIDAENSYKVGVVVLLQILIEIIGNARDMKYSTALCGMPV